LSLIRLPHNIEQHAKFPIASFFRIEVIETRLGPGITEPFIRGNGFGRMSDEEGVVDGRIELSLSPPSEVSEGTEVTFVDRAWLKMYCKDETVLISKYKRWNQGQQVSD
jgi:hypothetical protein